MIFIISGPLLIMINYDINKERFEYIPLNIFLLFPDQATPLTHKNNVKII